MPDDLRINLEALQEVQDLRKRIRALLRNVGEEGSCKGCQAPIYWVVHRNGKRAPYTVDGLNHFADCPAANLFRKKETKP